jgi:hypothetical protein
MKIDIEQVITRTKFRLGLQDTTSNDGYLQMLIEEAARHLDTVDSYVVTCEDIDVDCSKAKLPDNLSILLCMKLLDPINVDCVQQPYDPETDTASSNNIYNCCTSGTFWIPSRDVLTDFCGLGSGFAGQPFGNVFDTQNGYILFPSWLTVNKIRIWYKGLNVDENGLMILDDFEERGLSAYAAYQFASSGQNAKSYTPQQIALWQREATAQINKIRGKSAQMDHRKHKGKFAAIARAFLINPMNALNNNL